MKHITTGSHPASPWTAVEFVTTSKSPTDYHDTPVSRLLARVIYRALFDEGFTAVTLLAVSGHHRERYLLRSRSTTHSRKRTEKLASIANDQLPLEVGITMVEVDPAPLGVTPVPVHRLLTTRDHPVTRAQISTPTPFEQLLKIATSMRPHAIQLIVSRFKGESVEVSLRVADFSPTVATHTAVGDAHYHQHAPDIAAPFEAFNLTTNRAFIFDHGWQQHTETRLSGPPVPMVTREHGAVVKVPTLASARDLSRTPTEYTALFSDDPPAAPLTPTYAQHRVLPWVRLDVELLPAFCGLRAHTYHVSPWKHFGRAPPRITPQYTLREPKPPAASPPPSDPIPTAGELEIESSFGQTALKWAREQGANVTDDYASPFEEFTAAYPNQTHHCVILTDPAFIRGDLVAVATDIHQSSTIDRLTVFTDTTDVASRARNCLQRPFIRTDDGKTRLYTKSMRLPKTLDAPVHRLPATSEWILTPTGDLEYHQGGTVSARASPDDTFETITAGLPQVSHRDGLFTVTKPSDGAQRIYKTNESCFEEFEFVYPPAVPSWLVDGLAFATVLLQDGDTVSEYQPNAEWDAPRLTTRDRVAATEFFATYTVADPDRSLTYADVETAFIAWLCHQTEEPIDGNFSVSLKSAFPGTLPSRHSDDLQKRTWRYPSEPAQG